MLDLLEQTRVHGCLVSCSEKPRFIAGPCRSAVDPEGIASQDALNMIPRNIVQLGLDTEYTDEGPSPRTCYTITEKGMKVVELVKRIRIVLEE